MTFVSVTRLRLRSVTLLPRFYAETRRTLAQVRSADGFLSGSLLADRSLAFWTLTLWRDESAMRAYMTDGAHLKAMPLLLEWCDEASVVHWHQEDRARPNWRECDRRMRTEGRPSKLRHPSPDHRGLSFRKARRFPAIAI